MPVLSAEYLRRVYAAIATALGADEEEAGTFARCFVDTDLRGKDTQGIKWIPGVATWVRRGAARFGAPFTIVQEGPAYALVDGGHGVGQVVATRQGSNAGNSSFGASTRIDLTKWPSGGSPGNNPTQASGTPASARLLWSRYQ